jgi:hypothetical protein
MFSAHINALFRLRDATVAAKARTGDTTLGTDVRSGQVRVVRVTYNAAGASTVTPITGFIGFDAAISALNAL